MTGILFLPVSIRISINLTYYRLLSRTNSQTLLILEVIEGIGMLTERHDFQRK